MSEQDRLRWNERYRQGAYQQRRHPSELLVEVCSQLHPHLNSQLNPDLGDALDIACGAGRNALYLASLGYRVLGVDVSDVALSRAAANAQAENLAVQWQVRDLDADPSLSGQYQLICLIRYVNPEVLAAAAAALVPGGVLVVEEHLRTEAAVGGPQNPNFRVAPGELRAATADLEVLQEAEGLVADPDGVQMALARLVARRRE